MIESYLFDVGWLFFAVWSLIVVVVSLAAFARDLLPSRPGIKPRQDVHPADPV